MLITLHLDSVDSNVYKLWLLITPGSQRGLNFNIEIDRKNVLKSFTEEIQCYSFSYTVSLGHQTDSSSVWNVKWKPLQVEAKPIQNTDFQFHSFDDYVLGSNWLCDEFILLNTFTKTSITCCKHDKYLVPILTRFFIGYTVLVITIRKHHT